MTTPAHRAAPEAPITAGSTSPKVAQGSWWGAVAAVIILGGLVFWDHYSNTLQDMNIGAKVTAAVVTIGAGVKAVSHAAGYLAPLLPGKTTAQVEALLGKAESAGERVAATLQDPQTAATLDHLLIDVAAVRTVVEGLTHPAAPAEPTHPVTTPDHDAETPATSDEPAAEDVAPEPVTTVTAPASDVDPLAGVPTT